MSFAKPSLGKRLLICSNKSYGDDVQLGQGPKKIAFDPQKEDEEFDFVVKAHLIRSNKTNRRGEVLPFFRPSRPHPEREVDDDLGLWMSFLLKNDYSTLGKFWRNETACCHSGTIFRCFGRHPPSVRDDEAIMVEMIMYLDYVLEWSDTNTTPHYLSLTSFSFATDLSVHQTSFSYQQ